MIGMTLMLEQLGQVLLHLSWIGAVVGLFAAAAHLLLRRSSPNLRYATGFSLLCVWLVSVPVTVIVSLQTVNSFNSELRLADHSPTVAVPTQRTGIALLDEVVWSQPLPLQTLPESNGGENDAWVSPEKIPPSSVDGAVAEAPSYRVHVPYWLAIAYCGGLFVMMCRLMLSFIAGRRIRRSCEVADQQLESFFLQQVSLFGLKLAPRLQVCEQITIPLVLGVLRPLVILPASLQSDLSAADLRLVFLHELAHLRRYDHLAIVIQRLTEALLFFHPVVWWLSRQVSIEREQCCDDLTVANGVDRRQYAGLLYRIARLHQPSATVVTGNALDGGKRSRLRDRVSRLLGEDATPSISPGLPAIAVLLLLLSCGLGVAGVSFSSDGVGVDGHTSTPDDHVQADHRLIAETSLSTDEAAAFSASALSKDEVPPAPNDASEEDAVDSSNSGSERPAASGNQSAPAPDTPQNVDANAKVAAASTELTTETETASDVTETRVRGQVVTVDGQSLAGATVMITGQYRPMGMHHPSSDFVPLQFESQVVETDAEGRFDLPEPDSEQIEKIWFLLWVYSPKLGVAATPLYDYPELRPAVLRFSDFESRFNLPESTTQQFNVTYRQIVIHGTNYKRRPLPGIAVVPAAVRLTDSDFSDSPAFRFSAARVPAVLGRPLRQVADAEATVNFRSMQPLHTVELQLPHGPQLADARRRPGGTVDLPARRAGVVSGVIEGYDQLKHGSLSLTVGRHGLESEEMRQVEVDSHGRFSTPVECGVVRISCRLSPDQPFVVTRPPMTIVGARNPGRVRMKVVKAATVSGSVSLPDGTPLAGATVRANSSTLGADYLSSLPHESVTGRDGKFHCIVGPGELRQVMVTKLPDSVANDYLTRDVLPKISSYNQHPRLSPGQHYQHPPMKLTPPRTISGLVVDENDRPVSNAWVRSNRSRDHARTDKAGAFSMRVTSDFTRLEFIQPEGSSLRSRFYVTTELQRGVVGTIESRNPYRIRIRNDEPIVETSPRLQQALMKAIKPLQLRNASLKDVVKEFKRGTRIDAYIDEEQLRAAGRSPDTIRITASTRSQTLQRTLRDVLEPHGLTWREGKTGDGSSGASMSGPRILEDPDITIVPLTSGTR